MDSNTYFPIHETFQATLQGEGFWTGVLCDFIRLYGCPVSCPWCDTGYESGGKGIEWNRHTLTELLSQLVSPRVVISGGEPFIHKNLPVLCQAIIDSGRHVHIETSGAFWVDNLPERVWVTLSPKTHVSPSYPVDIKMWNRANELKLVISDGSEIDFYLHYFENLQPSCEIFLQPEWEMRDRIIPKIIHLIHQFTATHSSKTHAIESSNAQTFKHSLAFEYRIGCQLLRRHYNPPVWLDSHPHRFSIEVTLRAVCHPCDLYGVDMVEAQRLLTHFAESLPEVINDSPYVPLGTTEQLCLYFFGLKTLLDRHIKIVEVSVSEETGRITSLRSSELPFRFLRMRAWMHDGLNFLQASMSSLKAFFSRKTSAILAHRMSHLSS